MLNNLTKLSRLLSICLIYYLVISQYLYAGEQVKNDNTLKIANNNISIHAKDISLEEVLRNLCNKKDIQLVLNGEFPNKTDIAIFNQPTENILKKLLANHNYVLLYSNKDQSIKKVLVYESSNHQNNLTINTAPKQLQEELEWIQYLSTRPEDEAINELTEIITDKEHLIESQLYAIEQLSYLTHNKTIVDAMAKALSNDQTEIKEKIVYTLGQLEFPTAHQILGQIIFGEQDPNLRLQAVKQLANIETSTSKAFIKAATADSNISVQAEAEYQLNSYQKK